jgi:hypothetical protein
VPVQHVVFYGGSSRNMTDVSSCNVFTENVCRPKFNFVLLKSRPSKPNEIRDRWYERQRRFMHRWRLTRERSLSVKSNCNPARRFYAFEGRIMVFNYIAQRAQCAY